MVNVNPRTGMIYAGEKLPGDYQITDPPGLGYKLKSDWISNLSSPWEFDATSMREKIRAAVSKKTTERLDELMSYYPRHESETWATKSVQALAWVALDAQGKEDALESEDFNLIFAEAAGTVTPDVPKIPDITSLATSIINNKRLFESFSGKILKRKTDILRQAAQNSSAEGLTTLLNTYSFDDIQYGA